MLARWMHVIRGLHARLKRVRIMLALVNYIRTVQYKFIFQSTEKHFLGLHSMDKKRVWSPVYKETEGAKYG